MRCAGMKTFSRCAWPIVLTLAAGPSAAFGQSFACYPFQRGDTASRLARRLTGDAANKYKPWFDVVDLVGRSVPKSQYDRVRSGWRACVVEKAIGARLVEARQVVANEATGQVVRAASPPSGDTPRTIPNALRPNVVALRASLDVDSARIWLGAAVVLPAAGFVILGGYIRRRNAAGIFMWQFAYLFVREFERPLLQDAADPAIRA